MNKWNRLKKVYTWKVESIKNNPEPDTMSKIDKKHFEHVLIEMNRIDDDFDYNMKQAGLQVKECEKVIKKYLDEIMPKYLKRDNRTHAEEIYLRIIQVEDDLRFKEI